MLSGWSQETCSPEDDAGAAHVAGSEAKEAGVPVTYLSSRPCAEVRASASHCEVLSRARRNQLRRAPEPHHADVHAPIHPPDERLLEEGREPRCGCRAALHALQIGRAHV